MTPATFDYERPATLEAAIALLTEHDGEAVLMSGGQSLVPMLKLRLARPRVVVDLGAIAGLDTIEDTGDELVIGGRATHRAIADDATVRSGWPLIAEIGGGIGDAQVRDWGTIGGSCAHNDPAADWPAGLIAVGASIVCQGPDGERVVAAREFGLGFYTTVLEPGEIVTGVRVPRPAARSGAAYAKVARPDGSFAIAGTAVELRLDGDGRIETAGIGLTAVGPTAFAATEAESMLTGETPTDDIFTRAAAAAAAQSEPVADIHGSEAYRRAVAETVSLRALRTAAERATKASGVEGGSGA